VSQVTEFTQKENQEGIAEKVKNDGTGVKFMYYFNVVHIKQIFRVSGFSHYLYLCNSCTAQNGF
jgi:hypothetical protein